MNREDAFELLQSEYSERRLDAARALERLALPQDDAKIRTHLSDEQNVWVRRALQDALITANLAPRPIELEVIEDDPVARKMYLDAVRQMSDRVVHELRSILGVIEYRAESEFSNFDGSTTKKHLERMRLCLSAIDQLSRASVMANSEDLILHGIIFEEAESCKEDRGYGAVHLIGDDSLVARGDPALIRMIVRNAVANALDVSRDRDLPVTVSWGASDRDYWIAVLDQAGQLPQSVQHLFEFGVTTKPGHIGAGLALIQQAAIALGGSVSLMVSADGTTRLGAQWPRPRSTLA
jgi:signal transduction histidine kinase